MTMMSGPMAFALSMMASKGETLFSVEISTATPLPLISSDLDCETLRGFLFELDEVFVELRFQLLGVVGVEQDGVENE